jgi:hypothetical protein
MEDMEVLNLGETNILNSKQKGFIISEINRIKKISVKKTKLLYRFGNKITKSFYDCISNIPNILVIA